MKRAIKTGEQSLSDVREIVQKILTDIKKGGDKKALEFARKFDNYDGKIILSAEDIAEASEKVSERIKDDIQFAYENVKKFAEAQKATLHELADEYGVSAERIRQIETGALKKLKTSMGEVA